MKRFLLSVVLAMTLALTSCQFDDSEIWLKINEHEERIVALEELCKQMNTNISSLQTIVAALQNNDYVTGVTPVTKNGEVIGYTITFTKSQPITIYHGEDGQDGANGKDGYTPQIGVRQDNDGVYYWTIDGQWLYDVNGNKIKAVGTDGKDGANGSDGKDGQDGDNGSNGSNGSDGKDGITPQLKIENDYWYVSYDNGKTWTKLGKATGEDGVDGSNGANGKDGVDGDSFFQNVNTANAEYVIFTLADGTQIKLPTWYSFEQLRTQCNQMNTNITSLQTIVQALQTVDYLVSCVPLMENGVQIGYTLTFAKTGSIVIYHGKNGKDGVDGEDGTNGVDATVPVISAKTHTDNVLYWTINGEWLLDNQGNKIPVHGRDGVDGTDGTNGSNGEDGVTPQLKIEDGYWYVSYNNGVSWTKLGKATGENGKDGEDGIDGSNGTNGADGDAFFQSVTQDEDFIHLILSTGEQIDIPRHHPLSVTFTETEDIRVLASKTYSIGYTITGADDKTIIKALAQDGFRAVVKKTDNATGTIEITTPATILPTEILVFVTDGKERTIMRSINFVEGVIIISTKSYTISAAGDTVSVPISTNIDYTVEIPDSAKSWISVAETRMEMRDETLTFTIAKNTDFAARNTTIQLIDALGVASETILITQKGSSVQTVHVATAGTLEDLVENASTATELSITGTLNTFDFDFIKTMPKLNKLDLSGTSNTTLPASCLANSTISTILLPSVLIEIPSRAFYQAKITSIIIPDNVKTIGASAFYQCKSIKGNLVIPNATTSIGDYCFQECTFNGTLTLGTGLLQIGTKAFAGCDKFKGNLTIPNNVEKVGDAAFALCSGFDGRLTIGNGVKSLGSYTFFDCHNLTKVTIGSGIRVIGFCTFAKCYNLSGTLTIPDNVEEIWSAAFWGCTGFEGSLIIGSGVTKISKLAFRSSDYKNGSQNYYLYLPLNFSKVYSKSSVVPTIHEYTGNGYYYNGYSLSMDLHWSLTSDTTFSALYDGGTFKDAKLNMNLPHLIVPQGSKSAYASSTWGTTFTLIEETTF